MPRYRKKLRRYSTPPEYNFGGFLKKALPIAGAAANFIPGVGPAASMAINAGANAISSAIPGEEPQRPQRRPQPKTMAQSSLGYKYGGELKHGGKQKEGVFTKEAKKRGMSLAEYARKVLDNKADFNDEIVRKAKFAQKLDELRAGGNISDKTEKLIGEGYDPDQAYAIANNMADEGELEFGGQVSASVSEEDDLIMRNGGNYANPHYQYGGVTPMGPDDAKYNGPKHEQGGIPIDAQGNPTSRNNAVAEVEGGETRDGNYIFSDTLTVPKTDGKTFAEVHEMMQKRGASEKDIEKLKMLQERVQEKEGVQGGDDQQTRKKPMPEGRSAPNDVGSMTKRAQEVANRGATGRNAGQPVSHSQTNTPRMKGGGKMKKYQNGGFYAGTLGGVGAGMASEMAPQGQNDWLKTAADAAGYVVPSAMKAGMALTDPGVQDTPRMDAETVPVQSKAFTEGERSLAANYRAISSDPNASMSERLAAQSKYLQGRSNLAGKEADYRSQQQQFNAQQRSQAQRANMQAFQQDRELKAKEDAARKQLLMDAVTDPINQFRKNEAGRRSQIANILVSANQIQNATDRRNAIQRGLRAMGLDESEIQRIIARNER